MKAEEFAAIRKRLGKTQKKMAELLGVSVKAIHSYEQGWRKIPAHVERQAFLLFSRTLEDSKTTKPCWVINECLPHMDEKCPAWEFRFGTLCWFINGTICEGKVHANWNEKMEVCRKCKVMAPLLSELNSST